MADLDVHATDGSADDLSDEVDPLGALRRSIDTLDDVIVGALVSRFQLALAATAHKGAIQDPARELAVLAHVERFANDLGGHGAAIRELYVAILAVSRELQAGGRRDRFTHPA